MTDQERGEKMCESYEQTIQYWPPSSTSNPVKLVGVPFCPDLLKYDDMRKTYRTPFATILGALSRTPRQTLTVSDGDTTATWETPA